MRRRTAILAAIVVALPLALAGRADAHPHVFADGRVVLNADDRHELSSVTNVWTFDAPFSAFAVTGLDENHNGRLDPAELMSLAETSMESLSYYHFFTWVSREGAQSSLGSPRDYSYRMVHGRLILTFTMPLQTPVPFDDRFQVEVFDPEYFVAFTFPERGAVAIKGGETACKASYTPPKPLDAAMAAKLAAIPADEHDLPPALADAAVGLAHLFHVSCR